MTKKLLLVLVSAGFLTLGSSFPVMGQDVIISEIPLGTVTTSKADPRMFTYFPENEVYLSNDSKVYFWKENGLWNSGSYLPSHIVLSNVKESVLLSGNPSNSPERGIVLVPHAESKTVLVPQTESTTIMVPHTESKTVLVPQTESTTVLHPETKSTTIMVPHTESKTVMRPETKSTTKMVPLMNSETIMVPETKSTTKMVPHTESKTVMRPETKSTTVMVPQTESKTVLVPQTETTTVMRPETKSTTVLVPQTETRIMLVPQKTETKFKYIFYPDVRVYFDPGTSEYLLHENGAWKIFKTIPPSITINEAIGESIFLNEDIRITTIP